MTLFVFLTNNSPLVGLMNLRKFRSSMERLCGTYNISPQVENQIDFKSETLIMCDITGSETQKNIMAGPKHNTHHNLLSLHLSHQIPNI